MTEQQKTVRVRIAVVVDARRCWEARGSDGNSDAGSASSATCDNHGGSLHFVEADIPIPQPQTVEGEVVE